jgi:hypothetical protein
MGKPHRPQLRHDSAPAPTSGKTRASIATLAARLIAEGTDDYGLAKKKAAKLLGFGAHCELPNNQDIEFALRQHLALYARETQPGALAELRRIALNALDWLGSFSPWLSGPVLTGTANEFSQIDIELIGINPKEIEFFLLNQNVKFTLSMGGQPTAPRRPSSSGRTSSIAQYQVEMDAVSLAISLYSSHAERRALHPPTSRFHARAQRDAAALAFAREDHVDPSSM